MEKQVIIINGHPGSGKTTVTEMIAQKEKTFVRSSIDFVKESAEEFFDWSGEKTEENRKFLSDMKRFLNMYTDLIEYDLNCVHDDFMESNAKYMLIDIREKDEIRKYKELFNAITVLVENPRANGVFSNQSDAEVDETDYDYIIPNYYCLETLEAEVSKFLREVEMNKFSAELYLRNDDGDRFISHISSIKQAFPIMRVWLEDRGRSSLYTRQWMNTKGEIILDFGSHHTFFIIKNQKGLFL